MRRSVRAAAAGAALASTLLLGGCGGGSSSPTAVDRSGAVKKDPVAATQATLSHVQRATIELRFAASTGSEDAPGKDVGFELTGPFQLPTKNGELPVAELKNTRLLGDKNSVTTFISTGKRAWVDSDGRVVELRGRQLDGLRGTTSSSGADLDALHLAGWFATKDVKVEQAATTVTGTLDAPTAIADVLALSGAFGGPSSKPFEAADAERLRGLVRSSSVELVTGTKDAVLRHLHFDVRFAPEDRSKVAEVLPELAGVGLVLDLRLADVGKAVEVSAPKGS